MPQVPARLADLTPGTIPVGTRIPGVGIVMRSSLTAYLVATGDTMEEREWVPFTRVHRYEPVTPLVVFG
mgnify:FL=1